MEQNRLSAGEAGIAKGQPLNPLDSALHCVDRSIRGMGYPGFETQMLVWLSGQLDAGRLRRAIEQLSRRRPTITSRLVDEAARDGALPYWQMTRDVAALNEIELPSAETTAVLARAEELQSIPHDPSSQPPLRFYLLRRPGEGDVFLMQYNHVLMDQSASIVVLREIEQLSHAESSLDEALQHEPRHVVSRWLRRIPHGDRHAATQAAIELQGRTLRGRAAILGTGEEGQPRRLQLRIATRTADADLARAIHVRSGRECGLPNMSMSILACAFRAIRELGPPQRNTTRNYIAGIGLDMNLRRSERGLLQNLLAVVPIFARPDELSDRERLIRTLSRQVRDRLEARIDMATLRLVNAFQRKPRHIQWVLDHLLRWTYSLWYAYFGSLDSVGREFCGAEIEKVCYVGPTWSPMGLSLLANQFHGRLHLQATYDPNLVDNRLAEAFLAFILADLAEFVGT